MRTRVLFAAPALLYLALAPLGYGGRAGPPVVGQADGEGPLARVVISGAVRSADTGDPVVGARIHAPGYGAGTVRDRRGARRLQLHRVGRGSEVRLAATAPGFRPGARSVPVDGARITVDFTLTRADRPRVRRWAGPS